MARTQLVCMLGAACALVSLGLVVPATAQTSACVHLQVGSGYAAEFTVSFAGATIGPSATFDIGQTQCLPLDAVPNGIPFNVNVHAILGDTITCTPMSIPRSASLPVSITFNASGTTLNVHCDAPTADVIETPGQPPRRAPVPVTPQ